MHKLYFLKRGKARRAYCACGWVSPKWCATVDSAFANAIEVQEDFIEHLLYSGEESDEEPGFVGY